MKVLDVSHNASKTTREKNIKIAAESILKGGLVIYPTETCYAIGCDVTNLESIKRIYKIKKRDKLKPIGVIVADLKTIEKYGVVTNIIKFLVKNFMPGPLTVVVKKRNNQNKLKNKEIAFRISSHEIASKLAKFVKIPITATSANVSGQDPLYDINTIKKLFQNQVDIILNYGNLPKVRPSTYVCVKREKVKILRGGPIDAKTIDNSLKNYKG